jgi:hypothetical protein
MQRTLTKIEFAGVAAAIGRAVGGQSRVPVVQGKGEVTITLTNHQALALQDLLEKLEVAS